mmetsp:Transcript_150233/g.482796  ORF Transcript_150233/g.482796 Transcript_150233/m.482796 type:complete len:365 (+) Transcript_150233:189-1283(+)
MGVSPASRSNGRTSSRSRSWAAARGRFVRTRQSLKRRRTSRTWSVGCCQICFEDLELLEVGCEEGHAFCYSCTKQHIKSRLLPLCPWPGCGYEMQEQDVQRILGPGRELRRFSRALLDRAVMTMPGARPCPNESCKNVVIVDGERTKDRQRVECPCGTDPWCSRCRQPYHFAVECEEVQRLRMEWHSWIKTGRARWNRRDAKGIKDTFRLHAIEEAIERHKELDRDEAWKGEHCRICPHCSRIVEKIDGCNAMRCGVDADEGGNQQNGCGNRFQWDLAECYKPVIGRAPCLEPEARKISAARGKDVRHDYFKCDLCQSEIVGPRFRCVHCKAFNICVSCDRDRLSAEHPLSHVFQIYFAAEGSS